MQLVPGTLVGMSWETLRAGHSRMRWGDYLESNRGREPFSKVNGKKCDAQSEAKLKGTQWLGRCRLMGNMKATALR